MTQWRRRRRAPGRMRRKLLRRLQRRKRRGGRKVRLATSSRGSAALAEWQKIQKLMRLRRCPNCDSGCGCVAFGGGPLRLHIFAPTACKVAMLPMRNISGSVTLSKGQYNLVLSYASPPCLAARVQQPVQPAWAGLRLARAGEMDRQAATAHGDRQNSGINRFVLPHQRRSSQARSLPPIRLPPRPRSPLQALLFVVFAQGAELPKSCGSAPRPSGPEAAQEKRSAACDAETCRRRAPGLGRASRRRAAGCPGRSTSQRAGPGTGGGPPIRSDSLLCAAAGGGGRHRFAVRQLRGCFGQCLK